MKDKSEDKKAQHKPYKHQCLWFFLTALAFFVFAYLCYKATPFVFYNNDDLFIKQIASGELTGQPEPHLLHIGYLTGLLLQKLYVNFPSIPWYGALLVVVFIFAISVVISRMELQCRKWYMRIATLIVGLSLFYLLLLQHMVTIQYTTVTILVAAAALAAFYTAEDSTSVIRYLKNNFTGFLLFFIALNLRDKGCFMLLPIFFFIGCAKVLKDKKMLKSVATYATCLIIAVAFIFGINRAADSGDAWREFRAYNTDREQIYDYGGYPSYDENRDVYDALGISYQSYISASTRYQILLDENINADSMHALASLSTEYKAFDLKSTISSFIDRQLTSYIDRPLNLIVFLCYALVLILALAMKKYGALLDLGALIAGRMCIWGYLMYIGRSVPRITQGIYIAELFLLLSVALYHKLWEKEDKKRLRYRILWSLAIAVLLFCSYRFGLPNQKSVEGQAAGSLAFSTAYSEVTSYMQETPSILYLCDVNSFSYFTEDVFARNNAWPANRLPLGGWQVNGPWSFGVFRKWGISSPETDSIDSERIRFVFMNTAETDSAYLSDYYHEKHPEASLVLCDTFKSSNDIEFLIYALQTDEPE